MSVRTSSRASRIVLPISELTQTEISSLCAATASRPAWIIRAFSTSGTAAHSFCAAFAAWTAASTCSAVKNGHVVTTPPCAGLIVSLTSPAPLTQAPSINP